MIPACFQETQATGILHLRFLAFGGIHQVQCFASCIGSLQMSQGFAQQPVAFKTFGRKEWIEFGDTCLRRVLAEIPKAHHDNLHGTNHGLEFTLRKGFCVDRKESLEHLAPQC